MTNEMLAPRARDYLALMHCSAGDGWFCQATSQIGSWLREKGLDVDLDTDLDIEKGDATLAVRRASLGSTDDLSVRLVERRSGGNWSTELLVHDELGAGDWISVAVRNAEGSFVSVPRVARYLMQVLPLGERSLEFTDGEQVFHAEDIDRLIETLSDDGRHGVLFVAGSAEGTIPFEAFAKKVGEWAKEVYGLAQVIVLDPEATAVFEARVGPRFSAPPWAIRTYHPGVRFGDATDVRRHRILGTTRLAGEPDRVLQRLLGDIARTQAVTRPIDPAVEKVRRRFERLENRRLVESLTAAPSDLPTPPPSRETEPAAPPDHAAHDDPAAELALIRSVLGVTRVTKEALESLVERAQRPEIAPAAVEALRARVEALQDSVEGARDESRELLTALEDAQLEAEVARLDVDDRDARIRFLESRLKSQGDFEASYLEIPEEFKESRPRDFAELLDRVDELPSVRFTGARADVERLNQIDTNDAALRAAWDAVIAMQDYARAKADGMCDKGLAYYLEHTPAGFRSMSPGKFAETETSVTMQGFGGSRVFPVPAEIDPRGKVTMKAHFKLARIGMASPRMYVYDGHPSTPVLCIGYLGCHLTNTQTN